MKHAVITGPTGVVGISLMEELTANKVEVTAVCRPGSVNAKRIPALPGVRIVYCALNDMVHLPDAVGKPADVMFHFGWEGTYGADRDDLYAQNRNVEYTMDAVKAAARLGCTVFIGAGSQAECGRVEGKISPDTPCNPMTAYGAAKLSACHMGRLQCRQYGIRHNWLRILSMYGPYDKEYTMIMTGIRRLLAGERPKYTKGEQLWDYIYSKDAARAFYLTALFGRENALYCLGSGKPRLLKDYIYAIRDAVNPNLPIGIGELDYYPNQVMKLWADISSLQEDTGFAPQYSFEEGIAQTVQWARSHPQI